MDPDIPSLKALLEKISRLSTEGHSLRFHWCIPWEARPISADDERFLRDIRKRQKERKGI
jgi:hypothetical protein